MCDKLPVLQANNCVEVERVVGKMVKTPDETKKGMECCGVRAKCYSCPYMNPRVDDCVGKLVVDALAYIQQLERERDALAALYKPHGNCKTCMHKDSEVCDGCTKAENRWEWAGIKEDT